MKPQIISRFFGFLLSVLIFSYAFSQQSEDKTLAYTVLANGTDGTNSSNNSRPIETVNINAKVLNAFNKSFEPVSNLNWSKVGKNFLAVFTADGKTKRAMFTKKGGLVYSISYGNEKDLSPENRKLVKSTYFDYSITSAIEVKEDNRIVWIVRLEDADKMIIVRLENGEMEEMKHYQKSK
jgi:hypothetical protein